LQNRQFYTYKFKSSRLKEFNYNVQLTFEEAQEYGEVISLFDNQMLRSIRQIHNRELDNEQLDTLLVRKII
jgi:negative regulator of genetic competence, sporulation and motility